MLHLVKGALRHALFHPRGMAIGPNSSIGLPRRVYQPGLIRVGDHTKIGKRAVFNLITENLGRAFSPSLTIGDGVYIGHFCQFHIMDSVEIGNDAVLSDYIHISDTAHGFDPRAGRILDQQIVSKGPVKIGNNCFIGFGSSVLANVTLGDWCIVGAHSVVLKSFPGYCIIAGSPAKIVRRWSPEKGAWLPASE